MSCVIDRSQLLIASRLTWRLGGHLVHSMHGALKLLPYNLVNHPLPVHSGFPLERLRNHVYAEAKKRDNSSFRNITKGK